MVRIIFYIFLLLLCLNVYGIESSKIELPLEAHNIVGEISLIEEIDDSFTSSINYGAISCDLVYGVDASVITNAEVLYGVE